MKRKMILFLAVLCLCFLPQMATSWPPRCTYLCCPAEDWDAECWNEHGMYTTTCQWWWYSEGGQCP